MDFINKNKNKKWWREKYLLFLNENRGQWQISPEEEPQCVSAAAGTDQEQEERPRVLHLPNGTGRSPNESNLFFLPKK